jgi:DNA repair exonuclease SbcCD nuclease subunit
MPKQIRCLAIGDPHFQVNNATDCKELIEKLHLAVQELQPDFVVVLGDLLHTHEKVHIVPLKLATELITRLAQLVPVWLLIGNHDMINHCQFLTDNHPFNSFKKINNVVVCDRVKVFKTQGFKFVFCPFVAPERFEEALNTLKDPWDDATCIFAHQEFYGCRFNPVMTSTEGDIWPEEYPLVVSGHIHISQRLQDNIYYTGSSMQHSFAETDKKTVALVTFESKEFEIEKIDLEMPRKKIVYRDLARVLEKGYNPPATSKVKLVVRGSTEEFRLFRKSKHWKSLMEAGVMCVHDPVVGEQIGVEPVKQKTVLQILEDLIKDEDKYVKTAFTKLKRLE